MRIAHLPSKPSADESDAFISTMAPEQAYMAQEYYQILLEMAEEAGGSIPELTLGILSARDIESFGYVDAFCFAELALRTEKHLARPDFGFLYGLRLSLQYHSHLGYAVKSCRTLREALLLSEKFITTRSSLISIDVSEDKTHCSVLMQENLPLGQFKRFLHLSMCGMIFEASDLLQEGGVPLTLEIPLPAEVCPFSANPPTAISIKYDQPHLRAMVPIQNLNAELISYDKYLQQLSLHQCTAQLQDISPPRQLSDQIKQILHQEITHPPTLSDIAKRFHYSEATLKRKLRLEGTHYKALLTQIRIELAIDLLKHSSNTVDQIAWQLGYKSASSFKGLFKQWTGHAPGFYRKNN